jgi:hypothetical protein
MKYPRDEERDVKREGITRLDNIYADILNDGVDLLPEKRGRHVVDVIDALCVLRREGRCGRHGVAAMDGNDLLVRLEAPVRTCVSHSLINSPDLINATGMAIASREGFIDIRSARAIRAGNHQHSSRGHFVQVVGGCQWQ